MRQGIIDITGMRFGSLVAVQRAPSQGRTGAIWEVRCDCGRSTTMKSWNLRSGHTISCGCVSRARLVTSQLRHGGARKDKVESEYIAWRNMRARCRNSARADYSRYGGRGIVVCAEWEKYERFLADMGRRPSAKHSLDRIDVDGPYAPDNCRWATDAEQRNNKRDSAFVTLDDVTKTVAEWAAVSGLPTYLVWWRVRHGWEPRRAIFEKARKMTSRANRKEAA